MYVTLVKVNKCVYEDANTNHRDLNFMTLSGDTTTDNPAKTAKTSDFQLSQEESGFSLIIQDVSKDNEHVVQSNRENVCFTNL